MTMTIQETLRNYHRRRFNVFTLEEKLSIRAQSYQPIDSQKLKYDISVCSIYAGPKYQWFEQELINSVTVGYLVASHVATIFNAINCNVWPVYPVNSDALLKREHLRQIFISFSTSNEIIPIMSLHTVNTRSSCSIVGNCSIVGQADVAYWVNHCATLRATQFRFSVEIIPTDLPISLRCQVNSAFHPSEVGE